MTPTDARIPAAAGAADGFLPVEAATHTADALRPEKAAGAADAHAAAIGVAVAA